MSDDRTTAALPAELFSLGLDLDNTTLAYSAGLLPHAMRLSGRDRASYGPETHYWMDQNGWFDDQDHFLAVHTDAIRNGLLRELTAFPDASTALWQLSDAGVHISVATHRLIVPGEHARIAADTVANLDANRIPYRDLFFGKDKASLNRTAYIEDAPYQIESLREKGHRVLIFDRPYNRHLPGPRALSWPHAADLLLDLRARLAAVGAWS